MRGPGLSCGDILSVRQLVTQTITCAPSSYTRLYVNTNSGSRSADFGRKPRAEARPRALRWLQRQEPVSVRECLGIKPNLRRDGTFRDRCDRSLEVKVSAAPNPNLSTKTPIAGNGLLDRSAEHLILGASTGHVRY